MRHGCLRNCVATQEKRHQMMNDVKALCEVDDPGLVRFVGAYHAPENGQARPRCGNRTSMSAIFGCHRDNHVHSTA